MTIDGIQDEYIVDLNESADGIVSLKINTMMPCTIAHVSDYEVISARIISSNNLHINVDMPNLKNDGIILVRNLKGEKIVIRLKPNLEAIRERNYIFKLGKYSVDGKSATFNVISKENGINEPWSIVYGGEPIHYEVNKTKTRVAFTIDMELANEFISTIILGQDNSGKEITIRLKHNNSESVEVFETKEAD